MIKYTKTTYDKVIEKAARDLANGEVIGWFQGGSEFGPRALGNRSILADPRRADIMKYLNEEVKHREWWRPYAPIVTREKAKEWFDLEDRESNYMLLSSKVLQPDRIPGVTHTDGSARVQTVVREMNPLLYKLLTNFFILTEVPVLLNTSFNVGGEPIVETPEDAFKTFKKTKMTSLILNNFYVRKT
jgi:carbamoyltransferase